MTLLGLNFVLKMTGFWHVSYGLLFECLIGLKQLLAKYLAA